MAGGAGAALARTGAIFDGWLPYPPEVDRYHRGWTTVEEAAVGAGRNPSAITLGLYVTVLPHEDPDEARRHLDAYTRAYYDATIEAVGALQAFVSGPPEHCPSRLRDSVGAGAEHIVLRIGSLEPHRYVEPVAEPAREVARCR